MLGVEQRSTGCMGHLVSLGLSYWVCKMFALVDLKLKYSESCP